MERLQREYLAGTSRSRASLAHLRRSLGQPLGAVPEILELVVDPDAPLTGGPPTPDERAVAAALGLYALHQQSLSQPMHIRGERFGTALGGIARRGGEPVPGVTRRFQALGTAESWDEVLHHSRGLVQLLRGGRRGFDYGWFAQDLAQFVDPLRRDEVRLRWGRAFYRVTPTTEPTSTTSEEQ
ncbi:type I-E CRISPR-associated protein Cse2/CasB [Cellulomonas uda]|uniref:type I-E CRISPR-associated protein Cse2/CasB n=1 Tax=Cellulomonas uda TaxID=1714 RepID=UPI00141A6D3D|nr:type I-E CRISPR-associated protein Cse2/CasB [Cellulomonas uda]NII65225.1 CRISPR system Cascade subunit CasB [Cellulomonas uda]